MKLGMAYYGAHLPAHLAADMAAIHDIGCDEVLITLAENDMHILTGKVEYAPGTAHDLGMRILANFWGFACAFGGGRVSRLLTENPDVWIENRDGTRLGQGCMNHPALLGRAREMVDRCVAAGYDGFFWDEPTVQDCYCAHCREKYRETLGGELRAATPEQLEQFRLLSIAGYVATMSEYVKSQSAGLETATCVMPTDRAAWEITACITALDTFGSDPYWLCFNQPPAWVSQNTRPVLDLCRRYGKRSLMWLQGWNVPAGREAEIEEAARLIASQAPDALYTWSYLGGQGTNETCADPAQAWAAVGRAYRTIQGS